MRNKNSRFHLPSKEWKKVVRFNSCDYLLHSMYDDPTSRRKPKLKIASKRIDDYDMDDYDTLLESFFGRRLHSQLFESDIDFDDIEIDEPDIDDDDYVLQPSAPKKSSPVKKEMSVPQISIDDIGDDDIEIDEPDIDDEDYDIKDVSVKQDSTKRNNGAESIISIDDIDDADIEIEDDDTEYNTDDSDEDDDSEDGEDESVWDSDDTFTDSKYGKFSDITSLVDDAVSSVMSSKPIELRTESGEKREIMVSDDSYVNSIYYVLESMFCVSNRTLIDSKNRLSDLIIRSGTKNGMAAYKIRLSDIYIKNGALKFVVSDALSEGYMNIYFVNKNNINFMINYPNININDKKNVIVLNYYQMCHLLTMIPFIYKKKKVGEYFGPIVTEVMNYMNQKGVNVKLLKAHSNLDFNSIKSAPPTVATFKSNFDMVANYSTKSYDDISILYNAVLSSAGLNLLGIIYKSDDYSDYVNDEYYIAIGGNEKFYKEYSKSNMNSCIDNDKSILVKFFTVDPVSKLRKIEHNMLLMPLSRFMLSAASILLFLKENRF